MSAAQLLRHSRKLRSLRNAVDCERSSLARYFSTGSGSSAIKENGAEKRIGGTRLSQYNQPGKELETFKVSLGVNGSSTCRRTLINRVPSAVTGLNGSLSCGRVASARSFSSSADLPPHQEIGMPSLSPTMTEGNIAKWLKKEGDKVSPGEVLCEVETDKATVEMESMEEGYLAKIVQGDGAKEIKVGEVICVTVEEEGDIEKFKDYKPSAAEAPAAPSESKATPEPAEPKVEEKAPAKASEPKAPKAEESSRSGDRIFASPLARKLAEDNNVQLSSVKGTGPDGRILKADIEDYLASAAKGGKSESFAASGLDYTDIPNAQIRKVTANRLLASKQTIPHYYLTVDTRVDKLIKLRGELNPLQEASGGKKISINDLVIKAAALALRKVPQCNSSWMNDFIRQYNNVNINVAVQTEHGLFVPVVRDADKKGLGTIGEEVKQLAQRARDNSLKPQDYEGGTFTVSNLGGPFGIKQFCAIINPPQSAILAIGSGNDFLSLGGHDDKKHALSVKMDNNGEDEISWKKEGAQPSDIHGSSTLDGSHAEFRTFSEVPDFVCSDRGGLLGSKKRKLNYISKMNYYLRADCVSDINPISNREARSSYSLRYEELKERSRDLAKDSVLLSTCTSIKSSGIDTVTQIFMDICGLTISLQKNLSKLDINMLSEAAFARAGIKPKDFYSTFAGKILEPKRLLSCYEIPNDSTIRVNARLRGGCGQDRTWDDIIRLQQRYETVSLPPEDLVLLQSDGSAKQDPVLVKFLAALLQLRSRDVLTQLCRKHYSGTSYGGKFTSKDILFDPDGNVRINSAPEKFTQESAKLDYVSIGKILGDSFKFKDFYPMHFYQLVDFLKYGPAVDCQSESVIAFVTNHVSLISHYRRVSISEILVQLIERLHPDVVAILLAELDQFLWEKTVEKVAAMKFTYYFHARINKGYVWVPYTNDGVSLLKFSNNFFKHHKWTSLDKLDAAFSLVMQQRNFIPRFLFTILVTLKDTPNHCPELIQSFIDEVIEMLGNNVIDLERG